ncbi:maleylpyruvate isomerase family mycothiol-dependent enzyme [Pseudonocardia nematodicida]|uniref:Maleylpyruvate isomerase family mycothiol-dependent enzyme n=1 Tax=Pseudonocardia nematodicida TaxID=1206997 RepID=A0ABV1KFD2_9PSEU
MSGPDVPALAVAERADLAGLLEDLTPDQWEAGSLCTGWRVRDVVAHLIGYEGMGARETLSCAVRGRFGLGRMNALVVADRAGWPTGELVADVRRHLRPRGVTALFGGRIGLTDALIHHQDIRRALGLPRVVPAERLAVVLPFTLFAPPLGARRRVRGLRLVATDLDFRSGDGPEVTGPAEALVMAAAGRADALGELTSPGADALARRLRSGSA